MPQTPLGALFHAAFRQNETAFGERGVRTAIAPRAGETVLVFHTDTPEFVAAFGIQGARSDAMIFYLRESSGRVAARRLLFLELKGGDHGHAIEQLDQVVRAVEGKLEPILGRSFFDGNARRALILSKKGSPQDLKAKLVKFQREHGFPVMLCRPGEDELRKHLP